MQQTAALGSLQPVLEKLVSGIVIVDHLRCIRFVSAGAELLLGLQGAPGLSPGTLFELPDAVDNGRLAAAFARLMDPHAEFQEVSIVECLIGMRSTKPLMMIMTPASHLMSEGAALQGNGIAIFITVPDIGPMALREILKQGYNLTDRECDLCEAFLNEPYYERMADTCRLTVSSVRTYMKIIYEKTGQNSQAALMRLLLKLSLGNPFKTG